MVSRFTKINDPPRRGLGVSGKAPRFLPVKNPQYEMNACNT